MLVVSGIIQITARKTVHWLYLSTYIPSFVANSVFNFHRCHVRNWYLQLFRMFILSYSILCVVLLYHGGVDLVALKPNP